MGSSAPSASAVDPDVISHVHPIVQIRHHREDAFKALRAGFDPSGAINLLRKELREAVSACNPDAVPLLDRLWLAESHRPAAPCEGEYVYDAVLLAHAFTGDPESLESVLSMLHSEFPDAFEDCAPRAAA